MEMHELTRLLSVLGPVFGVISAILGGAVWLLKRHMAKLDEQIEALKTEQEELEKDCDRHKDDAQRYKQERDEAVRRREDSERSVAPLTIESANLKRKIQEWERRASELKTRGDNYKVATEKLNGDLQTEQQKRRDAESERDAAKQLSADAEGTARQAKANARTQIDAADQRARQADQAALNALKNRDEAIAKANAFQKERDELAASIDRFEKQLEGIVKQDGRVWAAPVSTSVPTFIPLAERKVPVISVLNLKGGVGKTTIAANLGGYLSAELEKRALMIDLDHQRSLTHLLLSAADRKVATLAGRTVQDFLLNTSRTGKELHAAAEKVRGLDLCSIVTNSDPEAVSYGKTPNLDDVEMGLLSQWLVKSTDQDARFLLRPALQSEAINEAFDYILIDCPPRLTTACINALAASDFVLIPTQAESVSIRSVPHLLQRLKALQEVGVLTHLQILGIVANMVSSDPKDKTTPEARLLRDFEAVAKSVWGTPVKLFKNRLKDSNFYASATRRTEENERLHLAVMNAPIREQYETLFKEIKERIDEVVGVAGVSA